jgi:tRNA/tmRNA/rRNA uracil-C5-methylase (TrmA/RlmC/RlmD family)
LHALGDWSDKLEPVRGIDESRRWRYRNRVCLHATWRDGWQLGLRRAREVVAIAHCPTHSERVRAALRLLLPVMPPADAFPLAFYVQAGAQITLVLKCRETPATGWLNLERRASLAASGVEGLWLNCHPAAGRQLFAKRGWRLLWGSPRSQDASGLEYGPGAFQQLLPAVYESSVDIAEAFLQPAPDASMLDLYSGRGATLRRWRARDTPVIGVELDGESLRCAANNAPGAHLLRGTCAQRLPQLQAWIENQRSRRLLAYVNPPRTGLESEVTQWLAATPGLRRLAYLSCSAGTLARDLRWLEAGGFRVTRLLPFDFFPQTTHVEVLALLQR